MIDLLVNPAVDLFDKLVCLLLIEFILSQCEYCTLLHSFKVFSSQAFSFRLVNQVAYLGGSNHREKDLEAFRSLGDFLKHILALIFTLGALRH